jgi:hypothetical protein
MTTAGDNITKANITASMEALKSYNSGIVWGSHSQPFQTDITGGDATGYATQTYADEISDTNITASTIVTNFRAYATLLSRIRRVRLLKYYQIQGDVKARTDYDQTNITNLKDSYKAAIPGGVDWVNAGTQPISDATITASGLDAFVNNLSTVINNNRTDTVTIEEFYCHSNCHGSCHGSI